MKGQLSLSGREVQEVKLTLSGSVDLYLDLEDYPGWDVPDTSDWIRATLWFQPKIVGNHEKHDRQGMGVGPYRFIIVADALDREIQIDEIRTLPERDEVWAKDHGATG